MGGHAAWRKRVAAGGLAKGSGGAALRHRPRFGRRGADLALNRLGNIGGHGNPKKKKNKVRWDDESIRSTQNYASLSLFQGNFGVGTMIVSLLLLCVIAGINMAWNAVV
jgi:hypothetical protein